MSDYLERVHSKLEREELAKIKRPKLLHTKTSSFNRDSTLMKKFTESDERVSFSMSGLISNRIVIDDTEPSTNLPNHQINAEQRNSTPEIETVES